LYGFSFFEKMEKILKENGEKLRFIDFCPLDAKKLQRRSGALG